MRKTRKRIDKNISLICFADDAEVHLNLHFHNPFFPQDPRLDILLDHLFSQLNNIPQRITSQISFPYSSFGMSSDLSGIKNRGKKG